MAGESNTPSNTPAPGAGASGETEFVNFITRTFTGGNPPASTPEEGAGGDVVLDGGPKLTTAEQWARVKDLPANLKAFSERMRKSSYFDASNPRHVEAVQDATLAFGARAEVIHAQDTSDLYYGLELPGFSTDERNALVSVARRDGIGADVLMRLVGAANHVGPGVTKATLQKTWGLEFDARSAAIDRYLDAHPALQAYAFALDENERAQVAYSVNDLLKYEGSVDAELETLMSGDKDSAYWNPAHKDHEAAVRKVTELHRRRYSTAG